MLKSIDSTYSNYTDKEGTRLALLNNSRPIVAILLGDTKKRRQMSAFFGIFFRTYAKR